MQQDSSLQRHANYLDFELEIGPGAGRDYPVALLTSPAGEARVTMHFPYDEVALDARLDKLQIALLRSGGKHRRVPSPEEQAVQDFGQALFDALLTGRVRTCYDVSLREAAQQDRGLRMKLRIRPPELSALPWEFLYDPEQAEYVCLSRQTPIVRYLESPRLIKPLTVAPPLRILCMVASPEDLPELDIEREKQRVERATRELRERGLLQLEWLPGQTWRDLQEAMWGGPWHVFHFVGHGGFDAHADEGFIALADRAGHMNPLTATRLGRLLADHTALRLVLLNACEGAKGSERDIYSSTASILVRRGIPAVVAMQYGITDRAAIEFARAFYRALASGMAVDEAVVAARKAISLGVTNTVEWGTPVLYMRTPDGVLFRVTGAPQKEVHALDPQAPEPEEITGRVQEGTGSEEQDARWQSAALYAEALQSLRLGQYQDTLAKIEQIQALDPQFSDPEGIAAQAQAGLTVERERVHHAQLASLYKDAQALVRAHQWQQALAKMNEILILDPQFADPEGLLSAARHGVAAQERRSSLVRDLYQRAIRAMDDGQSAEAWRLLLQVQGLEPGYRHTQQHLARLADRKKETPKPPKPSPSPDRTDAAPSDLGWSDWWEELFPPSGAEALASGQARRFAGVEMVYVPAGQCFIGPQDADTGKPLRLMYLKGFWIDRTPVTNEEYQRFVQATGHGKPKHWRFGRIPRGKGTHPVIHVNWHDAQAYCLWRSEHAGVEIRLPGEAEWEKAARGTKGQSYPWGDEPPNESLCNSGKQVGRTTPVGHYSPGGDSPYGLVDMAGNVWEWTGSLYTPNLDLVEDGFKGTPGEKWRIVRGGSWFAEWELTHAAVRSCVYLSGASNRLGFRCACSDSEL